MARFSVSVIGTLVLLGLPAQNALASVEFGTATKTEFSPSRGEAYEFGVRVVDDADVSIELYSSDGDLVRTLRPTDTLRQGDHKLVWDGKDADGKIVPDEVYVPVLHGRNADGKETVVDPRATSGGEAEDNLGVQITADRQIAYTLPAPSRVLARVGIKGGPLMRTLAAWEPRGAGKNILRWDGFDRSHTVDLRDLPGLTVLVTAFRLPNHAVMTFGNEQISYSEYRQKQGWPDHTVPPEQQRLNRGETTLSRQYYVSPTRNQEPQVTVKFADDTQKNKQGYPVLKPGQQVRVTVDVDKNDRWLIDETLYEVAFFGDYAFLAEEEQGYVPLNWLWTVGDMPAGEHVFTVNISGFTGKVGVASLRYVLEK